MTHTLHKISQQVGLVGFKYNLVHLLALLLESLYMLVGFFKHKLASLKDAGSFEKTSGLEKTV